MALGCLDLDTDAAAAAATMLGLWLLLFTCLNVRPRSFYLVYSWHGASLHPQPAPGLGPAPTWSEDNNCLLLRLPPDTARWGWSSDDSNTV